MNLWEHKVIWWSQTNSRFLDAFHLPSTTSTQVKQKLKTGISDEVVSSNVNNHLKVYKAARLQDLHI